MQLLTLEFREIGAESENTENIYQSFQEPLVTCLVMSDQQSKTQIYLVYNDINSIKHQILTFFALLLM